MGEESVGELGRSVAVNKCPSQTGFCLVAAFDEVR